MRDELQKMIYESINQFAIDAVTKPAISGNDHSLLLLSKQERI